MHTYDDMDSTFAGQCIHVIPSISAYLAHCAHYLAIADKKTTSHEAPFWVSTMPNTTQTRVKVTSHTSVPAILGIYHCTVLDKFP